MTASWRLVTYVATALVLRTSAAPRFGEWYLTRLTVAAPEIILVSGELVPERRELTSWHENHQLLLTSRPAPAGPLGLSLPREPRPMLNLALFWGVQWRPVAQSPARLRTLRHEAGQEGQFYPAVGDAPALLAVGSIFGVVSDSGLAVLRRHGVPVRVP